MKIRVENKVKTTTTYEVIFASIMGGFFVSIGFGPVAGILAAIGGFACGYPVAMRDRREEADRLIDNDISDEDLYEAIRAGKTKLTVSTELKNIHPGLPPLGRILFGDKLTKETTYHFDE